MTLLKDLKLVILVVAALLTLVIIRYTNQNVFKERVATAVEITQRNGNLITLHQLKMLQTPYLVIDLTSKSGNDSTIFKHALPIQLENLLDEVNRKAMDEARGAVILFSEDEATVSKAWIILNQLGYKNLLVLSNEVNPEVLKYKFQPDTTARLEKDSID